jgi:hypothetical protein
MKTCFAVITLVLISFNAHAGLNKWVDADGKVHYSDTPPPDVTTEKVRNIAGKGQPDATVSFSPKSVAEREADMKKAQKSKEEEAQKKEQQDAVAATRKSNCEGARQNAHVLEEGMPILTYGPKGERVFLNDSARAQRLEEARKAVSSNCN